MLSQTDTIVMLMLENRSLDNVLGWLYHEHPPQHVVPSGSSPLFDGIPPNAVNFYRTTAYSPAQCTQAMPQPCRVPRWDPYEPFEHVKVQLFADANGNMPGNPWSTLPGMGGFVYDFNAFYTADQEVMGAYSADQLPVLYGLASNFAVSDRWFASVPTQTDANRAFSICGTSLGGLDNGTPATYQAPTLFNVLAGHRSFGIYWQYHGIGSGDFGAGPCYTLDLFPQIQQAIRAGAGVVQPYSAFLDALAKGEDIPQFCYLEPFWGVGKGYPIGNDFVGVQGNDYHPPTWIGPAEYDLNQLYRALRASKQWAHMLFIITFDEHGGTWDHVPPTPTVAPDDNTAAFDFKTLGVRVPTILVSPFVAPGTVFRPSAGAAYNFDHTSTIATVLGWAGIDAASAGLGQRVAVAPTFESALSAVPFDTNPTFTLPAEYANQGGGKGLHLLDLDISRVSVRDVRVSAEHSQTVEQFTSQLAARTDVGLRKSS